MPLNGVAIKDKFKDLLSIDNSNTGVTGLTNATCKYLEDGMGNDFALSIGQNRVGIGTAAPAQFLTISAASSTLGLIGTTTAVVIMDTTLGNEKRINFKGGGVEKGSIRFTSHASTDNKLEIFSGSGNIGYMQCDRTAMGDINGITPAVLNTLGNVNIMDAADPLSDLDDASEYLLVLQNSNDGNYTDTKGAGIAFSHKANNSSLDGQLSAGIIAERTGNNNQGALHFFNKISTGVGDMVKMLELNESGKTAIRESGSAGSVTAALTVLGNSNTSANGLHITNASKTIQLYSDASESIIETAGAYGLLLRSNGGTNADQLNLFSNGRVGVKLSTTPNFDLEVAGTFNASTSVNCGPTGGVTAKIEPTRIGFGDSIGSLTEDFEIKSSNSVTTIIDVTGGSATNKNIDIDYKQDGGLVKETYYKGGSAKIQIQYLNSASSDADRAIIAYFGGIGNSAMSYGKYNMFLDPAADVAGALTQTTDRQGYYTSGGGFSSKQLASAPTAKPDYGTLWVKNDNTLHWVDPDGVDHTVTIS